MIQRLSQFIKDQGISVRSFEQSISASDGMIRRAINNNSDIQCKWLSIIAENYPHLNLTWLITGKGAMLNAQKESPNTIEYKPPIELIPSTDENTVTIPIVEISVAAGTAGYCNPGYLEIVDGIKLPISMLHRNAQYYCIRVKGDSMAPTILDSSYVVVRFY